MSNQPSENGPFAEAITSELKEIVDKFNEGFAAWEKKHMCKAEMGWAYRDGKALEIREIVLPVYRKPVPKQDFGVLDRTTKPE